MKSLPSVKRLVAGIGVFTALSLLASFCNFLFNFVLIRLLPAAEFRDLVLANNLINIFGNLFVALNLISIAVFFISREQQASIVRACQKLIYTLYIILLGFCVVFSGAVQQRTGLHDTIILNFTLAVILFSIPVMVLNAIYLGMNRFNRSAVMNICLAFGRMLLGIVSVILVTRHKDVAAVASILVVFVVVFALFTLFEKEEFRHQSFEVFKRVWEAPLHVIKKYRLLVVSSLFYAVSINFLLGLDLFIFGQFFTNDQSADYAAISVIGKLSFFFIAPISLYLAARQQQVISSKPAQALKTSLVVNALVVAVGVVLALLPMGLVSLLIHRPAADINQHYLLLSVVFNCAVVLTNHQLIEAVIGQRQRTAVVISGLLLVINGGIFIAFQRISEIFGSTDAALLALGLPATTLVFGSLTLFVVTHLFGWRRKQRSQSPA